MTSTLSQPRPAPDGAAPEALTFETVYDAMFPVVWRTARRLGIPPAALDDVCQEVFVIVFRRLGDYDGRASVKSWVCGILVNVVREHRRRSRRKDPSARSQGALVDAGDLADPATSPYGDAQRAEATRIASALLDEMDDAKRHVFVLAELEEMTAPEIAEVVGANVNTVYARLRAARQQFQRSAERFRARRSRSGS